MSLINSITTTGSCVVTIFSENNPTVLTFSASEGTSSTLNVSPGIYLSKIQAIRIKNTTTKTNTIILSDGTNNYTYTSNKSGLNKRIDFSSVGTYSNEFLTDDTKIPPVTGVDEHIVAVSPSNTSLSVGGKIGVSHFADNVYVDGKLKTNQLKIDNVKDDVLIQNLSVDVPCKSIKLWKDDVENDGFAYQEFFDTIVLRRPILYGTNIIDAINLNEIQLWVNNENVLPLYGIVNTTTSGLFNGKTAYMDWSTTNMITGHNGRLASSAFNNSIPSTGVEVYSPISSTRANISLVLIMNRTFKISEIQSIVIYNRTSEGISPSLLNYAIELYNYTLSKFTYPLVLTPIINTVKHSYRFDFPAITTYIGGFDTTNYSSYTQIKGTNTTIYNVDIPVVFPLYLSEIQSIVLEHYTNSPTTLTLYNDTDTYNYVSSVSGTLKRFDFASIGTYSSDFSANLIPPSGQCSEVVVAESPGKTALTIGGKIGVSHFADNVYVDGNLKTNQLKIDNVKDDVLIENLSVDVPCKSIKIWKDDVENDINQEFDTIVLRRPTAYLNSDVYTINIREIQLWVNNQNVLPNVGIAPTTQGTTGIYKGETEFVLWNDLTIVLSENNISYASYVFDNNINNISHDSISSLNNALFIAMSQSYKVKDIQSIVLYNRTDNGLDSRAQGLAFELYNYALDPTFSQPLLQTEEIRISNFIYRFDFPAFSTYSEVYATSDSTTNIVNDGNTQVYTVTYTESIQNANFDPPFYLSSLQSIVLEHYTNNPTTLTLSNDTDTYTYVSSVSGLLKRFDFASIGTYSSDFSDNLIPPSGQCSEVVVAESPTKTALTIGGKIGVSHFADNVYVDGNVHANALSVVPTIPGIQIREHNSNIGFFNGTTLNAYINKDTEVADLDFTGQHRSFIKDVPYYKATLYEGRIVCANQNTNISISGKIQKGNQAITQNETLPYCSLSSKSYDKSCFGVISTSEDPNNRISNVGSFYTPYEKETGDTRIYINSLGEGAMWVSNQNGPLESGDYITTSDVLGYGMKQDSENLSNYTVAKITMDCDFNPISQPIQIIKKDKNGNNILNEYNEIQWTDKINNTIIIKNELNEVIVNETHTTQFIDSVTIPLASLKDLSGENIIYKTNKIQYENIESVQIENTNYNIIVQDESGSPLLMEGKKQFIDTLIIPVLKMDTNMQIVIDENEQPVYENITIDILVKDLSGQTMLNEQGQVEFIQTISIPQLLKDISGQPLFKTINEIQYDKIESVQIENANYNIVVQDESGSPLLMDGKKQFIDTLNIPVLKMDTNMQIVIDENEQPVYENITIDILLKDLSGETMLNEQGQVEFIQTISVPQLLKDISGQPLFKTINEIQYDKIESVQIENTNYNIVVQDEGGSPLLMEGKKQFIDTLNIPVLKMDTNMQIVIDENEQPVYENITIDILVKDLSGQTMLNEQGQVEFIQTISVPQLLKDISGQYLLEEQGQFQYEYVDVPLILKDINGLSAIKEIKQFQYVNADVPLLLKDINGLSVIKEIKQIQYVNADVPLLLKDINDKTIYLNYREYGNIILNDLNSEMREIPVELKDAKGQNIIDEDGQIKMYTFTIDVEVIKNIHYEYAYNIRYLNPQAEIITKEEYDISGGYIAAYVGCTYHCG